MIVRTSDTYDDAFTLLSHCWILLSPLKPTTAVPDDFALNVTVKSSATPVCDEFREALKPIVPLPCVSVGGSNLLVPVSEVFLLTTSSLSAG